VAAGGYLGQKVSRPSSRTSEVVGLIAAIVVLVLTFGSAVAMGLPIFTAMLGLIGGLSILTLISRLVEVPTTAPALATMIGLGVGIDYGLFMVTRHREQLRDGLEVRESIAPATATAGGAVVFAGGTVIIALLALALADIPLVTTLGYTSAIVVFIAVAGAITLLPALMSLAGRWAWSGGRGLSHAAGAAAIGTAAQPLAYTEAAEGRGSTQPRGVMP